MENYFEEVIRGTIRGVTSYIVKRKLAIIEKTIQRRRKQEDGQDKK
ncbi:MAG: hypothetical protein ABS939_00270 [Psychrobacillus sp.]